MEIIDRKRDSMVIHDSIAYKLTPQELEMLKEIRKQTKAPYLSIIAGIKKCGLDKEAVINYLREIAIVYA